MAAHGPRIAQGRRNARPKPWIVKEVRVIRMSGRNSRGSLSANTLAWAGHVIAFTYLLRARGEVEQIYMHRVCKCPDMRGPKWNPAFGQCCKKALFLRAHIRLAPIDAQLVPLGRKNPAPDFGGRGRCCCPGSASRAGCTDRDVPHGGAGDFQPRKTAVQ
jgi:hypothetical protein